MRKQYYFRRSDRGLLAWDVDRFVELSTDLPIQLVPLAEIAELDEPHWFSGDDTPTCRAIAGHARLINEADLTYPIILASDGRVMDGMHRVCKAEMLGQPTIEAVRFDRSVEPDYVGCHPDRLPY